MATAATKSTIPPGPTDPTTPPLSPVPAPAPAPAPVGAPPGIAGPSTSTAVPAPSPSIMQAVAAQVARDNQVTPTLNTYDETKGVAGRVAGITMQDSPLMQQARTSGTQLAARRGLTNSTLAGQAEQNAVIAAATPIATADASLYQQTQQANQAASMSAATTNAQTGAQLGQTGLQLGETARESDNSLQMAQQQLDTQRAQFAQQLGVTVQDLALRRDTLTQQQQQFLANLDQQQKALAQQLQISQMSETTKASTVLTSSWQTMMSNIQAIQNNANLDGPAKQQLVQNALDAFASYSRFWQKIAPVASDIQPLLDFGTIPAGGNTSPGAAPNANAGSTPGAGVSPGAGPAPVGVYVQPPETGGG